MRLRSKTVLILIGVFIAYGILEYAMQRFIIFPNFLNLEQHEARQNLKRVIGAINEEAKHLDLLCHDWSAWDDTYAFVVNPSQEYVTSNLKDDTFFSNDINLIYICDMQGRVVWGKILDLGDGKQIRLQSFPAGNLGGDHPLIGFIGSGLPLSDVHVAGILMTERGPLIVSSRPILTSENGGPIRGYIIFGKFLTSHLVQKMKNQTQVDLFLDTDQRAIKAVTAGEVRQLDETHWYYAVPSDKHLLHIYTLYRDIKGLPAFLIRVTMPRDIVLKGMVTMRIAMISVILVGIGVLAVMLLLIRSFMLLPIEILTNHALSIRNTNDYTVRLHLDRKDEIGTLADQFDMMVEKIDSQTQELGRINEELRIDISKRIVTEQALQEANRELDELARIDALTGIPNRRRFDESLEIEWRRMMRDRRPISLILCDVDSFKLYNDTYGHQAGDDCLRAIARVIRENTRRAADSIARYGGEEFALILPGTDADGAIHLAEVIRSAVLALKIPHRTSAAAEVVSLSMGVASMAPDETLTQEDLLDLADRALYDAKDQGKNRSVLRVPLEGMVGSRV